MADHFPFPSHGGANNLSALGARLVMSTTQAQSQPGPSVPMWSPPQNNHFHDRLDALEQELLQLRGAPQHIYTVQQESMQAHMPVLETPRPFDSRPHMAAAAQQALVPASQFHTGVPALPPLSGLGGMSAQQSHRSEEHKDLMSAHKDLLTTMDRQQRSHTELLNSHRELMKAHKDLLMERRGTKGPKKAKHPALGVIRLDYNYPPAAGDTDCPGSFGYDVFYRVIPGLTFEMAQAGKFTEAVERNFAEGIKFLEQRGVSAITGDCGFMMAFQVTARKIAAKPVFMSSMCQCPVISASFEASDQILVLTANGQSLRPQKDVLLNSCGFDVDENRFIIKGCQDVPGFDAVANGQKVPVEIVQPGIVRLTLDMIQQNPRIKAILLECTELPPYADALRAKTGLPVWDAITGADFYISACKDNPRFGLKDWQDEWDHEQEDYSFGTNLIEADRKELVHKIPSRHGAKPTPRANATPRAKATAAKVKKQLARKQNPVLGVVRLDYNYPPAEGDIDCPGSYDYEVLFRCVPGLTFAMAQSGRMTPQVERDFVEAVKWLQNKGCCGITGDCGFMMAFQRIARQAADIPVFMSSMVQCPMISVAFDKYDKTLILTANSATLKPQKGTLLTECGFDVDNARYVIYGCQDVPGFDAVEKGQKVDVEYVTPGIVHMTMRILEQIPSIRSILLECTELPPYADALRKETGLPVFDAITCTDFFVSARKDNPRFGLNQWQNDWDGQTTQYDLGGNLTLEQRARMRNG